MRILIDKETGEEFEVEQESLESWLVVRPVTLKKIDRWVYNDNGVNPWPEGCVVECIMTGGIKITGPAHEKDWRHNVHPCYVASRYVGPAEGWTE